MLAIRPTLPVKILSTIDNEDGMAPLWIKDLITNAGRSYMEYNRGGQGAQHAGRERLFEEFSTTLVWLGGREVVNRFLLNPVMRAMGLDPKVDLALLSQKTQHVPEWIASRMKQYQVASVARFLIGTLLPVAIIGFVIPPVNQAITRFKLNQEAQKQGTQPGNVAPVKPASPQSIANKLYPAGSWAQPLQNQVLNPSYPALLTAPGMARFGSFGSQALQLMSNVINNDRISTMAIDAGISGGRFIKARNWVERLEVTIREASIILFLYLLSPFIKNALGGLFDKQRAFTGLTYDAIHWLGKKPITASAWKSELALLNNLNAHNGFNKVASLLNPKTGRFDNNPLLELARLQGKIPILSSKSSLPLDIFRKIFGENAGNAAVKYVLDPRRFLDIDKLKDLPLLTKAAAPGSKQALLKFNPYFSKILKAPRLNDALKQALTRTKNFKALILLASYGISGVCLAVLSPMFQHWLTYKLTGKVDFPGVRTDVDKIKPFANEGNLSWGQQPYHANPAAQYWGVR